MAYKRDGNTKKKTQTDTCTNMFPCQAKTCATHTVAGPACGIVEPCVWHFQRAISSVAIVLVLYAWKEPAAL